MGNCQAAEAAAAIVQHPGGRVERLYWPTSAGDVMRSNPGHYVALVVVRVSSEADKTATSAGDRSGSAGDRSGGARITRVKLLKPKDMLLLGQVYRLITSQEVTKALRARKHEKMKRCELINQQQQQQLQQMHQKHNNFEQPAAAAAEERQSGSQSGVQEVRRENDRHRGCGRGRQWRPSLQSISESMS